MVAFFQHLNSIHPLSAEAAAGLMKVVKIKELRRGQVWLQEGAVCDKMTFVVKGLMKLYFESGCKEVIMELAKEDEWMVAANSFFSGLRCNYIMRCVEPSVVNYINKVDLDDLLERHRELNFHFKIIAENQGKQYEVHAALLMLTLKERFDRITDGDFWMVNSERISDRLLAAYLGMTPNSFCGFKKK